MTLAPDPQRWRGELAAPCQWRLAPAAAFPRPGRLYITCQQESGYNDFAAKTVASEATLYLKSEPALLDKLIVELGALSVGNRDEAYLEAI